LEELSPTLSAPPRSLYCIAWPWWGERTRREHVGKNHHVSDSGDLVVQDLELSRQVSVVEQGFELFLVHRQQKRFDVARIGWDSLPYSPYQNSVGIDHLKAAESL
jgi:hypothetical protein